IPTRLIAAGESQSAFRLVTYIDAIHPLARVYDGYLVHSRSGVLGAALSESPEPAIAVPGGALIRSDLDVPALIFATETDLTFLSWTTPPPRRPPLPASAPGRWPGRRTPTRISSCSPPAPRTWAHRRI